MEGGGSEGAEDGRGKYRERGGVGEGSLLPSDVKRVHLRRLASTDNSSFFPSLLPTPLAHAPWYRLACPSAVCDTSSPSLAWVTSRILASKC